MSDDKKEMNQDQEAGIGVYICHCGGNISDHVDVEKVREQASRLPGVTAARDNHFMCSDPGQELIMEDIKSGRVNRVVVASCAPSLHETTFRKAISRAGMNPYLYEHANIREQVSWVHHGDGATAKAAALTSAAAAKTRLMKPLESLKVDAIPRAVVIGGGPAGMKAARELVRQGVEVVLVEKTPFLGGSAAQLDRVFPHEDEASVLLQDLADDIMNNLSVSILTCAEVTAFQGYVGQFKLTVKRRPPTSQEVLDKLGRIDAQGKFVPFIGIAPGPAPDQEEEIHLEAGAVVMATGFEHYQPYRGEYGYQDFPEVITLPDLIKLMADEKQTGEYLTVNNREIKSVAIIHCVGSRHIPGLHEPGENGRLNEYCSRVCCAASLQASGEIKDKFPETAVYELYRDIRAYGRGHEENYFETAKKGTVFLRFEPENPPVVSAGDNESALTITARDYLLGNEEMEIPVDLVVLAVGMVPNKITSLVEMMKLPVGADGFLLEVHPKLRPVELANAGVLLAGTCQAPMDITESTSAASAAAVKASAILGRGFVELDPFTAQVAPELCTGCGLCLEACQTEDVISLIEQPGGGVKAQVNPALCLGCGMCAAVCPEEAIQVNGYTLAQYRAMVDAIMEAGPGANREV